MDVVLYIFIFSFLITFLFSLSIAIAFPLFKKYYNKNIEGFLPIYNLFKLCYIVGINEFVAFLYLIPCVNIFLMILMGIRLKGRFDTYKFFEIGFVVFPIIFIPLAAYIKPSLKDSFINTEKPVKKKKEKNLNEKTKPKNIKDKQEETEIYEYFTEEETNEFPSINLDDESIFKLQSKIKQDENGDNKPYKAKKIMVNEDFINSAPAEQEVINKIDKKKRN